MLSSSNSFSHQFSLGEIRTGATHNLLGTQYIDLFNSCFRIDSPFAKAEVNSQLSIQLAYVFVFVGWLNWNYFFFLSCLRQENVWGYPCLILTRSSNNSTDIPRLQCGCNRYSTTWLAQTEPQLEWRGTVMSFHVQSIKLHKCPCLLAFNLPVASVVELWQIQLKSERQAVILRVCCLLPKLRVLADMQTVTGFELFWLQVKQKIIGRANIYLQRGLCFLAINCRGIFMVLAVLSRLHIHLSKRVHHYAWSQRFKNMRKFVWKGIYSQIQECKSHWLMETKLQVINWMGNGWTSVEEGMFCMEIRPMFSFKKLWVDSGKICLWILGYLLPVEVDKSLSLKP